MLETIENLTVSVIYCNVTKKIWSIDDKLALTHNKQFALVLAARHCKEIFILRNVDWFLLLDYLIAQKEIFMSTGRSID